MTHVETWLQGRSTMRSRRVAETVSYRLAAALVALALTAPVHAFEADVAPLVQKHCIACHTGTILGTA